MTDPRLIGLRLSEEDILERAVDPYDPDQTLFADMVAEMLIAEAEEEDS